MGQCTYKINNFENGDVLYAAPLNSLQHETYLQSKMLPEMVRQMCKTLTFPLYTINGNILIIGDSTIAGYPSYTPLANYFKVGTGFTITDISKPGDTIIGQNNAWNALEVETKNKLNYVFCQIGLNDIDETKENFRIYYKSLIESIRRDAPNAKLILGTMTPCKDRWKTLYGDNWENYFNKWISANNDIKNRYYDCDEVAYFHTDALGIDDVLRPEYDHGDKIHENAEGAKIVAFSWYATAF